MAKAGTRKCPICKEIGNMDEMVEHKKFPKRFIHKDCLDSIIEQIEKEEQEAIKRNKMYQCIADIYDVPFDYMPTNFFAMIERLRNGNAVFKGKVFDKRYKQGFDYEVIERAYLACRESIEYANKTKDFKSTNSQFLYGLKIVVDRIPIINHKYQNELKAKEVAEIKDESKVIDVQQLIASEKGQDVPKRKKKNDNDISQFLD